MDKNNKLLHLEGLRGTAAILVVIHHFLLAFYPAYYFGGDPAMAHTNGLELAYFRSPLSFITNGEFMVCIFFILSGYVLSHAYYKSDKTDILVSASIRRFPRLYIPVAFTLIIAYVCLKLSLISYDATSAITKSGWLVNIYTRELSFKTFAICFTYYTMLFGDSRYVTTMRTMVTEFYGSMMVFALLALTHKIRAKWVMLLLFSIVLYFIFNEVFVAFVIGISLNYLDRIDWEKVKARKIIVFILTVSALFLGGFPTFTNAYNNETFYHFISSPFINTNTQLVHILGGTFLIAAILISPGLQKIFSGRIFTFLGHISFSIYLIHPIIIGVVACPFFLFAYGGANSYNLSAIATFVIFFIATIIVSKLMTELVDIPGTKFSRYLYERFFKPKETVQ